MDIPTLMDKFDEAITIDLEQQRKLGTLLIEYSQRENVPREELRDMLRMIGL
jgi:hypothetical protein